MMTVLGCIVDQHNHWFVLLAALVCLGGSWVMARLFHRAATTDGVQRVGWHFMTAVAAGVAIWCTHFIAMLGFSAGTPIAFDPLLTGLSLLIAIAGSTAGFVLAGSGLGRFAPLGGGAVVGLAIACMHYTGMLGYRVSGLVSWDVSFLVTSVVLSVTLAALALQVGMLIHPFARNVMAGIFALAIISLHFTGMAAFHVEPLVLPGNWANGGELTALALAIAGMAVLLVSGGVASYLIDDRVRSEAAEALRNMSSGIVWVSPTGTIRLLNERVHELFGLDPAEARIGMPLAQYIANIGARCGWDDELVRRIVDAHFLWMAEPGVTRLEHDFDNGMVLAISCCPIAGGGAILTYDDVTEARTSERKIAHMAFHDTLTGLPNRAALSKRLDEEIEWARASNGRLALIGIDLDRFKEVNDLRGHAAGDQMLKVLAQRMGGLLQEGDFVARVGGDEFIAVHRLGGQRHLLEFVAQLEAALFAAIQLEDSDVVPGASMGVAIFPDDAADKETLIGNADLAMYRAKSDATQAVCFYEPGMDEKVRNRRALAQELRDALQNGQFEVHYQVQTTVEGGHIRGYEALLRWRHPTRGLVQPSEFIPLAEENGMILQIGRWVLRHACATAASWHTHYKIAVNLSAIQLADPDLPQMVAQILDETGLAAERLELELTESMIFADRERSLATLRQIKALGVSIALDDFGTGYSSLDMLRAFPFDKIKLDRSFMAQIETSAEAKAIIRAVLALGKSLNTPILAEGIETTDQLAVLRTEGCDEVQGFLLGRPATRETILDSGQLTHGRIDVTGQPREEAA